MIKQAMLVEVGSGQNPRPGYIHCDIYPWPGVEYLCPAWAIPFKPGSIDEIYCRHMLEHLTFKQARRTLAHWFLLLKPGARIDVNVPDLAAHLGQLTQDGPSPYLSAKVSNREHALSSIYGWQRTKSDFHRWGYTYETLCELLAGAGLENIRRIEDDSLSGPLNLRVIAQKPQSPANPKSCRKFLFPAWAYFNYREVLRKFINSIKV